MPLPIFQLQIVKLLQFLISKRGILIFGLLVMSVALPLIIPMGYTVMVGFYLAVMFSFGATVIIVNTPIMVLMQKKIDDDYKGRVFSILETIAMALMPLGMVIYGFLYDLFAAEWILTVSGFLLIFVVLILARPSVVRKAHPELVKDSNLKAELVEESSAP